MSFDEILGAVEELRPAERTALAQGPLDEPACRVCAVLRPDGHHPVSEAAEVIVDWHLPQFVEKVLACAEMLGTTAKPPVAEVEEIRAALIEAEGTKLRAGIDTFAEQLGYMRCLYVYTVAGWQPHYTGGDEG